MAADSGCTGTGRICTGRCYKRARSRGSGPRGGRTGKPGWGREGATEDGGPAGRCTRCNCPGWICLKRKTSPSVPPIKKKIRTSRISQFVCLVVPGSIVIRTRCLVNSAKITLNPRVFNLFLITLHFSN
jgi:hypothetical protein